MASEVFTAREVSVNPTNAARSSPLTKARMKEYLNSKTGKNHKADSFHKFVK